MPVQTVIKNTHNDVEVAQSTIAPPATLRHSGFPKDSIIQDYVSYAYNLGGIEFVAMMECENGTRDPHRA